MRIPVLDHRGAIDFEFRPILPETRHSNELRRLFGFGFRAVAISRLLVLLCDMCLHLIVVSKIYLFLCNPVILNFYQPEDKEILCRFNGRWYDGRMRRSRLRNVFVLSGTQTQIPRRGCIHYQTKPAASTPRCFFSASNRNLTIKNPSNTATQQWQIPANPLQLCPAVLRRSSVR